MASDSDLPTTTSPDASTTAADDTVFNDVIEKSPADPVVDETSAQVEPTTPYSPDPISSTMGESMPPNTFSSTPMSSSSATGPLTQEPVVPTSPMAGAQISPMGQGPIPTSTPSTPKLPMGLKKGPMMVIVIIVVILIALIIFALLKTKK